MNQSDIAAWRESVEAGRKPLAMAVLPAPRRKLWKAVTEGMERGALNLSALESEFDEPLCDICRPGAGAVGTGGGR